MDRKFAVLAMDVEDWRDFCYPPDAREPEGSAMLDGFDNYVELLNRHGIKTTFFVPGEKAESLRETLLYAEGCGHEIACGGLRRESAQEPPVQTFAAETREAKRRLEDLLGRNVTGYRAPGLPLDAESVALLKTLGFRYSASLSDAFADDRSLLLNDRDHPLPGVRCRDGFTEFAPNSRLRMGVDWLPVSDDWLRALPWHGLMKHVARAYLRDAPIFTMTLRSFELSREKMPRLPGVSAPRAGLGRVEPRMEQLIDMLETEGFEFVTFGDLSRYILREVRA